MHKIILFFSTPPRKSYLKLISKLNVSQNGAINNEIHPAKSKPSYNYVAKN